MRRDPSGDLLLGARRRDRRPGRPRRQRPHGGRPDDRRCRLGDVRSDAARRHGAAQAAPAPGDRTWRGDAPRGPACPRLGDDAERPGEHHVAAALELPPFRGRQSRRRARRRSQDHRAPAHRAPADRRRPAQLLGRQPAEDAVRQVDPGTAQLHRPRRADTRRRHRRQAEHLRGDRQRRRVGRRRAADLLRAGRGARHVAPDLVDVQRPDDRRSRPRRARRRPGARHRPRSRGQGPRP